jgi:ABC-type molybdate transport system substrate-binding protein
MADAGIASWNAKYEYDFWRPVTGIRDGANDGNPDTVGDVNWTPLGAPATNGTGDGVNFTPPFPSYTSGHATFGGAVSATSKAADAARALLAFLKSPAAIAVIKAQGMEPI